ncbi:hypothetical protein ACFVUY_38205 [Kitasatospora sp. NPDC058063]|uniref:hypothetical protein n=1 Tax=unclassified Kitasatospora TaxID=2633591 RepID=UPI0036DD4FA3
MMLRDLTVGELEGWERPSYSEIRGYWARYDDTSHTLALPGGRVRAEAAVPSRDLPVWVDAAEGWLWVQVPRLPAAWCPPDQLWPEWKRPAEKEIVPLWVRGVYADWRHADSPSRHHPFLIRRRLDDGEAAAFLDELLPPVEQYGVAPELAVVLRSGGWHPHDLAFRLYWTLETVEDAGALAARPPQWWEAHGWPLAAHIDYAHGKQPEVPFPPARDLAALLAAGTPGRLVTEYRERGRRGGSYDLHHLLSVRAPVIPDDTTRVEFTGSVSWFATEAEVARDFASTYPERWLDPVVVTTTPVEPLHISPRHHLAVWSDGARRKAEVLDSTGRIGGAWPPANRQLAALEEHGVLARILGATDWHRLATELPWQDWADTERVTSDPADSRESTRPLAAGIMSTRTLTLTGHRMHRGTALLGELWELTEQIVVTNSSPAAQPLRARAESTKTAFYTDRTEAQAALEAADDGMPPVMTVSELAEQAGVSRRTFAQALRRERAKRMNLPEDWPIHPGGDPGALYSFGSLDSADDGNGEARAGWPHVWYNPREALPWWHGRPGHGPGRGHKGR